VLCWRPAFYWKGRQWSPLPEAVDSLGGRVRAQVICCPSTANQDRGLSAAWQAEGLVPERLLQRSEERQIDHLLPAVQTVQWRLGW